ncbi:MAG TPA: hypothetical protein VFC96_02360 [Anaerovoracaceae bacterium]|nr:hypothetical protein [Anaerovoracaceae bacterium]
MPIFDPQCITYSQMNLMFNARYYYRRLTTWTRAYLMSRYFNIGTTEALFERLYLETLEIGRMLYLVFGRRISEEYSQLLSQYAIIFHQLIDAQLEGNIEAVNENVKRLYQNVEDRAIFISSINPYWSAEAYQELFNSYIKNMIESANAILEQDSVRDIELYDMLNEHTDRMGDVFAEGIYAYLTSAASINSSNILSNPGDVPCVTQEQMDDIYTVRMLWFELIVWTRNYMIQRYAGTGDPEEALIRLMQVPVTYVTTLSKYFPDIDVDQYLQLFFNYITLISDFVTAMIDDDVERLNEITVELYRNADERAAFIASINPEWNEEERRNELYANLSSTIEQSNTFLTGDYERNIDIFTRLLDQAEIASAVLSNGLFEHITGNQPPG